VVSRLARSAAFRLALYAVLATLYVWPVLGDAARGNEFRDAEVLSLYERTAIDTVQRYHELPLWNPYYCGGLDAVGAPQSRFVSPTLLLGLVFGAARAEPILVFLFVVLGMEGMYRWLRLRVTSPPAAMLVAPVFALSGHFAVAYFRGWIGFFGFELVPWIVFGVTLATRRRLAGVAIASVAFAIVLGFGGTFAAPLVAVAAVLEGLRALVEQPRADRRRALVMLAITASFMASVALVRLWPIAETLAATPRIMAGTPGHRPEALLQALVGALEVKDGDVNLTGSFFVGSAFLALVALGGSDKKSLPGIFIVLVFAWFSCGYARNPPLFALLRELPVFAALRYPERFLWLGILFASEPAAHALSRVPTVGEGRRWRIGAWIVLTAAVAWTVAGEALTFHRTARARLFDALAPVTPPAEFHQTRGNRWLAAHYQALGVGSLSCWETHPVAQSPLLRGDLPAEEYLDEASREAGTVRRVAWSPNRVALRVEVASPARVLVNQNWHPGWRASVGTVVSNEGLLAVDVPAGAHDVTLAFRPWSTFGGAAASTTALVALALLALRARRGRDLLSRKQRVVTVLATVAPWLVAGAAKAASPEPRFPSPVLRNANGAPALVETDAPPAAPELGTAFSVPLRLESGRVLGPDAHAAVTVELFLRRTGHLAKATTMFVHVERRKDLPPPPKNREDFFNADHQVVAGSFYLSDAPEGRLVRDVFGVKLEKAAPGTWDVFVAFGHVSGRQGRARVVERGHAVVDADRVKIGSFVVR